jgi:hypothetical protein
MSWIVPTAVGLVAAGLGVLAALGLRVLGEVRALSRTVASAGRRLGDALTELDQAGSDIAESGARPARTGPAPAPGVPSSVTPG